MNAKTVTFNMPIPIYQDLRVFIGHQNMSKFVSEAVKDKLAKERDKLKLAYMQAEKEPQRRKTLEEWGVTEGENWK